MRYDGSEADWARPAPRSAEAPLLLGELHHRTGNEVAAALAAMRLAQSAGVEGPRVYLFDRAIQRLEGFGKVHDVLAARPSRTVDVDADLHRLCFGLVAGRAELDQGQVWLSARDVVLPGGPGRRLMLIAAELMANAFRHAIAGRGGNLWVTVHRIEGDVQLVVQDDGPGLQAPSQRAGTGLGSGIVEELVLMGGGRIECVSDVNGTVFTVRLPLDGPSPIDWMVREDEA